MKLPTHNPSTPEAAAASPTSPAPATAPIPIPRQKRGFSLIEVAVTIAIAAFIVSTVVTVVPMALSWHRDSIQESVMSAAVQELVREIEQTPFASSSGRRDLSYFYDEDKEAPAKTFFYDFEGTPVDAAEPEKIVFQAQVKIDDVRWNGEKVEAVVKRGSNPVAARPILKRVTVYVLFKPQVAESDIINNPNAEKYSIVISDRGDQA